MSATQEHATKGIPLARLRRLSSPPQLDAGRSRGFVRLPFNDLIFQAQSVHRQWFDPNEVQKARFCRSRPAGAPKIAVLQPEREL